MSIIRARRLLRLLFLDGFSAARSLMWATLIATLVNGIAHGIFPLGFKMIIDATVERSVSGVTIGVLVMGALITAYWVAAVLDANLGFGLSDRMRLLVSSRIAEQVNAVSSIEHLERPDYLSQLQLLEQNRYLLDAGPRQTLTVLSSIAKVAVIAVLLAMAYPLMIVLPLLGLAPAYAQSRSIRMRERAEESVAEAQRAADAFFQLASTAGPAKELRVFGLADHVQHRFAALSSEVTRKMTRAALLGSCLTAAAWVVFIAGFAVCIVVLIRAAVDGEATPGDVVIVIVLAQQVRQLLTVAAHDVAVLLTIVKVADRAMWLEDVATSSVRSSGRLPAPPSLSHGIEVDALSFSYPGSDVMVLRDVELSFPAGSTVAIVGENGAGKSTLVKLLAGLYQPTSGQIRVDGVDVTSLDPAEWRSRVSAVFQDHVPFELTAGRSVGVGDLPRVDDREAVEDALSRAHAAEVVSMLAHGLDTQIGRSFADGQDLSGGQWQKLALGRGMMRFNPLMLILDEPTASLDADAEHELFELWASAARRAADAAGTVTLLVSHRFSTVRSADLIVVLGGGGVIEVGSHDELMGRPDSTYVELYRAQAVAYS